MTPFHARLALALIAAIPDPVFSQRLAPPAGGFAIQRSAACANIRIFPQWGGGYGGAGPFVPIVNVVPIVPAWSYYPPPMMGVMPPVVVSGQPIDLIEPVPAAPPRRGPIMPGQPAGRFRPIAPGDREQARARPAPEPPPIPKENPVAEYGRLIREGKKAFADGAYGRAGELFARASRVLPDDADSFLLLVQVGIALGKYADAASSAHFGASREPGWPLFGPPLSELYAGNLMEFARHRRALEDAAAAAPGDAAIQFLRAYAMWFEGRRDEARDLFRAIRPIVSDPAIVDRFLAH